MNRSWPLWSRDIREHLAVLAVATWVEWSLRTRDLPRTAARAGVELPAGGAAPARLATAGAPAPPFRLPRWARSRYCVTVRVMRRWPFGGTCLRRSLVLGQRLRRLEGVELHVGVRRGDAGELEAHAWLEWRGLVLDPEARRFEAFQARDTG